MDRCVLYLIEESYLVDDNSPSLTLRVGVLFPCRKTDCIYEKPDSPLSTSILQNSSTEFYGLLKCAHQYLTCRDERRVKTLKKRTWPLRAMVLGFESCYRLGSEAVAFSLGC